MAPPIIHVIIPISDQTHSIDGSLTSLQQQSQLPHKVIVAHDTSTDDAIAMTKNWLAAQSVPFDIIHAQCDATRGICAARNNGLKAIEECDYVYLLDPDSQPPHSFLEKTSALLTANPAMVAASTDYAITQDGTLTHVDSSGLADNPWQWILMHGADITSCTLLRYDAVRQAKRFDVACKIREDIEFFARISLLGKWGYAHDCTVNYTLANTASNCSTTDDYYRIRAHAFENCIENCEFEHHIPYKTIKQQMARHWCAVGEKLIAQSRYTEAIDCFRNSLSWQFIQKSSWLHLLKLRRLGISSTR